LTLANRLKIIVNSIFYSHNFCWWYEHNYVFTPSAGYPATSLLVNHSWIPLKSMAITLLSIIVQDLSTNKLVWLTNCAKIGFSWLQKYCWPLF